MAYLDNVTNILQIQPDGLPTYVRLSQNENGRNLYFELQGNEIDIPSNATVTISGTKPDGTVYSGTGSVTDNVVLIPEMLQMTAVAGTWDAKIQITSGGNTIATGRVRFVVDADTVAPGSVPSDSELEGLVAQAQQYAETARTEAYGSPLTAGTAAGMTDHTRVYVYTGSESGYTAGHWYFWNGSAWTDGGIYNSVAVNTDTTLTLMGVAADAKATGDAIAAVTIPTDKTLSVSDAPADAKVVGDELDSLKGDLNEIDTLLIDRSVNVFDTATISENTVLNSSGNGTSTSTSYFTSDYINVSDFSTTKLYRDNGVAVVAYNAYYVLFDASKEPLGARAVGSTIDTSNAYYLRFSAALAQLNEVMVCDGSATAPTDYVEYDVRPKYEPTLSKHTADIATNAENIAALTTTVQSANLIDKSQAVVGFLHSNGTIITSDSYANYKTSDYIPVTANTTYTLYYANSTGQSSAQSRLTYLLYNASKVAGTYVTQSGVRNLTITPSEDGYVRVSTVDNTTPPYFTDLLMLIEGTTIIPYEDYENEKYLSEDINPINSKAEEYITERLSDIGSLTGKKWAHCGDSFSDYTNATFSNGTFSGKYKTFPRIIAEKNGMNLLQNFMLSGRTMAYPADGTFANSLTCPTNSGYFQNIPSDVDYVTIMLGINDVNHANGSGTTPDGEDATGVITLGTIDDTTTETYYGAYNTVCAWLRENRPFAHVGIVITNGTQRQDYTEAQIAIAKKWGYPYINLNGDERTPAMIRCYNPNLPTALKDSLKTIQGVDAPSNTHPNWQTHELESTIIEAWLRSL